MCLEYDYNEKNGYDKQYAYRSVKKTTVRAGGVDRKFGICYDKNVKQIYRMCFWWGEINVSKGLKKYRRKRKVINKSKIG